MHARLSTCIGLAVVDDSTDEEVGTLSSLLIHPDLGTIEGCFVHIPRLFSSEELFVSAVDILHWGAHIRIHDHDSLAPLDERYRLHAFVQEGRTILGQRILTEGGLILGVCKDIQFNTKTLTLEWLFPRKFLRWGTAIPASAIVEVKREGVIVKESALVTEAVVKEPVFQTLEELAKAPV